MYYESDLAQPKKMVNSALSDIANQYSTIDILHAMRY
jgi:hypothetical protein